MFWRRAYYSHNTTFGRYDPPLRLQEAHIIFSSIEQRTLYTKNPPNFALCVFISRRAKSNTAGAKKSDKKFL
jgi:hypothetical protein